MNAVPPPPGDPAQGLVADPNALLQAEIDRVVLAQAGHDAEQLRALELLQELPPLTEEELARQAEAAPGADGDPGTPE